MVLDKFVITKAGSALISAASLGGDIVFTRGALGKGALSAGADMTACTDLVDRVADMVVGASEVDGEVVRVRCTFTNVDGQGGYLPAFRWNEAGLFARLGASGEEVLLAYANTRDAGAGDWIPNSACEFDIAFEVSFAGAENALFGSAGLMFVTFDDLHIKADAVHTHAASDIKAGTLAGQVKANKGAVATLTTGQVRNIILATSAPTAGISNGDIWLSYT